jgi:hypothetical protein
MAYVGYAFHWIVKIASISLLQKYIILCEIQDSHSGNYARNNLMVCGVISTR